jgi:hypothetical protein
MFREGHPSAISKNRKIRITLVIHISVFYDKASGVESLTKSLLFFQIYNKKIGDYTVPRDRKSTVS